MNAPKITTFVYCLGTSSMEGNNSPMNAMGILQILTPEYIPSTFSFSIIIGIKGMEISFDHKLDIIFKSKQENLVEAKDIVISAEQLKDSDPGLPEEQRGVMLGLDMRNVVFKEEGNYFTEVILDGKKLGEFDIYAKAKN